MRRNIPFLHSQNLANRVERNNLLEEIESGVTSLGVREVGDASGTGPGDDRHKHDANDNGAFDTVEHQHDGQDTAAKDSDPHGWVPHLSTTWANAINLGRGNTTTQLKRSGLSASDETDTSRVGETDDGEIESDTDTSSELDTCGDSPGYMVSLRMQIEWLQVSDCVAQCAEFSHTHTTTLMKSRDT